MLSFDSDLRQRLDSIRDSGLFRELRRVDSPQSAEFFIGGKKFLNFSSNDYLGLANHPALKEAATKAVQKFGAGAGASRLICGSLAAFHELEETLAEFKRTEAALTFSSGYAAAVGTITALMDRDDVIILDKLVHACIVDAARLSGAKLRVFDHNDLDDLESKLKWAASQRAAGASLADQKSPGASSRGGTLVITESVFSMDGDTAPLREIVALKEKYGAWLMVDEAHATGLFGKNLRGFAEALGVSERIEIQMGTLGKALGASGGYICGSRALIDFLVNRARSFIFSTAPVPAAAAAASAAIKLIQSSDGKQLNEQLRSRIAQFNSALRTPHSALSTAIIPILIGEESAAVAAASALREKSIFVPAIRFPTVARGSARLRVTLSAAHTEENVSVLAEAIGKIMTSSE